MYDFWGFWLPSMLMGVGIAIDVALATIAKFRDRSMSMRNWTLPIMGTHILFPALGYYGFWGLRGEFHVLSPVLGIIGFLLVLAFVYEVVCETVGKEPLFGISAWIAKSIGLQEDDSRRYVAILAVSWDALWSGPAKAAQAEAGNWNTIQVGISFAIAGLVVALVAQAAIVIARQLQQKKFRSVTMMARWFFWGKYVELFVISSFGVLSLLQAITGEGNIYASLYMSAAILGIVWLYFASAIAWTSTQEAKDAIVYNT